MASGNEQDEFKAAKGQQHATRQRPKPITGVTAETFWPMAKAFFSAAGGGFVIIRDKEWATHDFAHSPREWGAWMAYFSARRINRVVFDQKGKGTVPAQWPHQFDANWKDAADAYAADRYEAELAKQTRVAAGVVDAAARKTFVTNRLGYDPAKRRGNFREADLPEAEPTMIDKDLLLECYEVDVAKAKARKAERAA